MLKWLSISAPGLLSSIYLSKPRSLLSCWRSSSSSPTFRPYLYALFSLGVKDLSLQSLIYVLSSDIPRGVFPGAEGAEDERGQVDAIQAQM